MVKTARAFSPYLVLGALAAGLVLTTIRASAYTVRPYLYDSLYLPSGKFLEQISMGYQQITADLVWFSAVQYYGGYRKEYHDLAYFDGLVDLVNELDPQFVFPYVFGAVVMSQDLERFDRAERLLKRGMHNNPTDWTLPFELGFLYYVDARNPELAARYFDLSSRLPGAPDRARRFAAVVYSKAGHTDTSIKMWEELARSTDEPYMRELAQRYLKRLRLRKAGEATRGRS